MRVLHVDERTHPTRSKNSDGRHSPFIASLETAVEPSVLSLRPFCPLVRVGCSFASFPAVCHVSLMMLRCSLVAALVVLATLVGVEAASSPPYSCRFTSPTTGAVYDLSPMWRNGAIGQLDYMYTAVNDTFFVNVCGNTVYSGCSPANGVCQATPAGNYSDGSAADAVWSDGMRLCQHSPNTKHCALSLTLQLP
jgi:hypothetical protein